MSAPRRVETKPKADKNVRPTWGVGRTFLSACCFGRQECPPHVGLRQKKPKADKNVRPTSGVGQTFLSACCFGRQESPPHVGLRQSPRQTRMSAPRRVWRGHSCLPAASADRNVRPTSG